MRSKEKRLKQTVSSTEWEKIKDEGQAAEELLTSERFAFFRAYLENRQKSILERFAENRIKDTTLTETQYADDGTKSSSKAFRITRREQELELSGQYQFIKELLTDLAVYVQTPKEVERAQRAGAVEIQEGKERDGGG